MTLSIRKQIRDLYNSDIVQYLFFRYLSYCIHLFNSIILLQFLGELNYGIYCFGLMIISYIAYTNLGVNQSINTILATKKQKINLCIKIWNTAFSFNLFIIFSIYLLNFSLLLIYGSNILNKYQYSEYWYYIITIGVISNSNLLFISLYRTFGQFKKINLSQILPPLFTFIIAVFLKERLSLSLLLTVISAAHLLSFLFFLYKAPIKTQLLNFDFNTAKIIVYRGINLMIYNLSFQLITLTGTTLISLLYSTTNLGYFSLSVSLSTAISMIAGSAMFMFYPKLINYFSNSNLLQSQETLNKFHKYYVLSSDIITISSLLILPVIEIYFSKHSSINQSFKILILAQLFLNSTYGFSTLIIAKKKENKLTILGFYSVLLVLLTGLIFYFLGCTFSSISFSVLIGMFLYTIMIIKYGLKILNYKINSFFTFFKYIPLLKFLIIGLIIISYFINDNKYIVLISVFLFYFFSYKQIKQVIIEIRKLVLNKNILRF